MTQARRHHYVPKFYLRRFADSKEHIVLRARGRSPTTTSITNAAAETGLYWVGGPGHRARDSAEKTLATIDSQAAPAIKRMLDRRQTPPASNSDRQVISIFFALQHTRTPEVADRFGFVEGVLKYLDGEPITRDNVRRYLREVHLGFEPDEKEVEAATDFVSVVHANGVPTREERMRLMFDLAVREIAPRLEVMRWELQHSAQGALVTCDRLPIIWRPPSDRDAYEGVGIEGAEELWIPLSPTTLLYLRPGDTEGESGSAELGEARCEMINSHVARHCYRFVFYHPAFQNETTLTMAAKRPALRFNSGPLYEDTPAGRVARGDVLHMWVPIRDDATAS